MWAIPQTPWKTDVRSHRLARQQVVCLASGVSPRRSDKGYERANGSMAVVPSSPCNVPGPSQQRRRSEILWRGIGVVGAAQSMINATADAVIAAFDKVIGMPRVMPTVMQETVYQWLAL